MKTVLLPDGHTLPALGLGTWRMGEAAGARAAEVAAVRRAFEIGYRVIDTAEMYGEGGAESVVGEALSDAIRAGGLRREDVFVVSKVYPHNAEPIGAPSPPAIAAASASGSTRSTSICCTGVAACRCRKPSRHSRRSAIATRSAAGASATSTSTTCPSCGRCKAASGCATNQIYYSLTERGPDVELLPWQQRHGIPTMAYSPDRPGRVVAQRQARGDGGAARRLAGAAGTRLDPVATERDGDSKGRAGSAPARKLRGRSARAERRRARRARRRFPPPAKKSPLAMR